jgi:hypothetical protein
MKKWRTVQFGVMGDGKTSQRAPRKSSHKETFSEVWQLFSKWEVGNRGKFGGSQIGWNLSRGREEVGSCRCSFSWVSKGDLKGKGLLESQGKDDLKKEVREFKGDWVTWRTKIQSGLRGSKG